MSSPLSTVLPLFAILLYLFLIDISTSIPSTLFTFSSNVPLYPPSALIFLIVGYFSSTHIAGKIYPKDKSFFSPFKYGGIEVKATCGSTPSASIIPKPLIGEQRITKLKTFDWKAHHRNTNNLLSILWDFIDGIPAIAACFYRNDLTTDDWGKIVQPKSDGGRTTSVSIMTSSGVKKMCDGWIAVIDSEPYISVLSDKKWIGYRVK